MPLHGYLPLVHVLKKQYLDSIITNKELSPVECKVFNCDLLYFFYGSASYLYYNKDKFVKYSIPVDFITPVAAVVKIQDVSIADVYASDTGYLHREDPKQVAAFRLGNAAGNIQSYMSDYWCGPRRYLNSVIPTKDIKVEYKTIHEFFEKKQLEMNTSRNEDIEIDFDERIFRTEVQINKKIELSKMTLIAPDSMLHDLVAKGFNKGANVYTYFTTELAEPYARLGALNGKLQELIHDGTF